MNFRIKLVEDARKRLQENPFDSVHNESHHESVWINCQKIVKAECLDVDMSVLEVAAWWHDVQRDAKDETELLRSKFRDLRVPKQFQGMVIAAIASHSFGKQQETVESVILYDADKLEYLSVSRVRLLLGDFSNGKMSQDRFDYYIKAWKKRIKGVRKQLHYKYSRELFEQRLPDFLRFCENHGDLKSFVDDVVL
jgi:hypothetical protein